MRILFTGMPAAGHILPMLPTGAAALAAGHQTALTTSAELAPLVAPMTVLPVVPARADLMTETARRPNGGDASQPGAAAVELFAGTAVDLAFDAVLEAAQQYRPDLVICEQLDFVGPLVATTLGVPWVRHGVTGPLPAPLWDALLERSNAQFAARALRRQPRKALIDIFPEMLLLPGETAAEDAMAMRPGVHQGVLGSSWEPPPSSGRPRVLLTLGTSVREPAALSAIAAAAVAGGADVLVTADHVEVPGGVPPDAVQAVGFVPLADALTAVDLVISAGGTGTLLATLGAGLPLVIRPFLADQPWNAKRVAPTGAALVVEDLSEITAAVSAGLDVPSYRARHDEPPRRSERCRRLSSSSPRSLPMCDRQHPRQSAGLPPAANGVSLRAATIRAHQRSAAGPRSGTLVTNRWEGRAVG